MAEQQKGRQEGSTQQSQQSTAVTQQSRESTAMRSRMPSLLTLSPYEMLTASPFQLMRRMMEEMDRMVEAFNPSMGQSGAATSQLWSPKSKFPGVTGRFWSRLSCQDSPKTT